MRCFMRAHARLHWCAHYRERFLCNSVCAESVCVYELFVGGFLIRIILVAWLFSCSRYFLSLAGDYYDYR